MTCEDCASKIIEHAHNELNPEDAGEVARHLAACSDCALEFCRLRADLDGVAKAYERSPRPGAAAQLRARVQAHVSIPWSRRVVVWLRQPIPAYGALAAAAAPVAMWFGLNLAHSPGDTPNALGSTPALIKGYDASELLRVDPNLL